MHVTRCPLDERILSLALRAALAAMLAGKARAGQRTVQWISDRSGKPRAARWTNGSSNP